MYPQYENDKNKLYKLFNILRWGIERDGIVHFEETIINGGVYLEIDFPVDQVGKPLFVVAEHRRYPSAEEFAEFIYNIDFYHTRNLHALIYSYMRNS